MYRRIVIAALIGVINAIVISVNGYVLLDLMINTEGQSANFWRVLKILGIFVLGSGPTYLLLRYGLVIPFLLTCALTTFSYYDHVSNSMESFTALYLNVWFVFVVILAVIAAAEYGFRQRFPIYPPEPLL